LLIGSSPLTEVLQVNQAAAMKRHRGAPRQHLAGILTGAGAAALAISVVVASSGGLRWETATTLLVGCDLMVAALAVNTHRLQPSSETNVSLALYRAIADGLLTFALSAATIVVLFGNSKPVERLGYLIAVLVLIPLSATLTCRRLRARSPDELQRFVAFATFTSTAGALVLARVLEPLTAGLIGASLFLLCELVVAQILIRLSASAIPTAMLRRLPLSTALASTPLLLGLAVGSVIPSATFDLVDIAVPLAAALVAFLTVMAYRRGSLSRLWIRMIDVSVLLATSLTVFYVGPPSTENQNYFLGPALDVLHGHPMLVDTFSQYGVGVIDALAVFFLVIPIGYGTFTLLLSGATVLFFVTVYAVLRWSTESVVIAAIGLTAIVVLDLFGQSGFFIDYPSTGVLRFGLPWAVILCSLAALRSTHHGRWFDGLVLAMMAVAAIWSGETAVYCLGTASSIGCLRAAVSDAGALKRMNLATRRVATLLAVGALSLLVFTVASWIATGVFPDWAGYLEYIYAYTVAGFGDLLIGPWSPGLAVGGVYTISAIAIVLLVAMRPGLVRERIASFSALTGLTVLGMLVYTYFLGRSHPNNVIHISLPAVALLFVWCDIARSVIDSRVAVATATATAVFFAGIVVAGESGDIGQKYSSTALAAALGSTASLEARLRTLWHNPVVEPAAPHIVHFIRSLGDGNRSLTLLLGPAVETEVLLRLGRASAVGSSNPAQESISHRWRTRISKEVHSLRAGGVLVVNGREVVLPIEVYAFSLLRETFALREIGNDGRGLRAFLLTPAETPSRPGSATAAQSQ
jgi:hypothetical protein